MEELQQAMDEFLEELTRQAMQQGQQMQPQEAQRPQDGRTVEQRDLQEMLDRARELMKSGARDAAKRDAGAAPGDAGEPARGHAAGRSRRRASRT